MKIKVLVYPTSKNFALFKITYLCVPSSISCFMPEPAPPPPGWQRCKFQRRCCLLSGIYFISETEKGRKGRRVCGCDVAKSRCFLEVSGKYCFAVSLVPAEAMQPIEGCAFSFLCLWWAWRVTIRKLNQWASTDPTTLGQQGQPLMI